VYVQYWGATSGSNWLGVSAAGATAGDFIVRTQAPDPQGWIRLDLPDAPNELELQLTRDVGSGVSQLLGRFSFETTRRKISIDAPEMVENESSLELQWSGETLQGDLITVSGKDDVFSEYLLCVPVAGRAGVAMAAPPVAGEYVIRYLTRRGRLLARHGLEVFEVLATLEGPSEIGPGAEFTVAWTGPDAEHDFLSVAAPADASDAYRSFVPLGAGNTALLRAPDKLGNYEVRYVRGADGQVLARQQLVVVSEEISIRAPAVVEAGTRFEVEWTGTPGTGDFVAVAKPESGPKQHMDWSFTTLGSPLTLAAPFEPGRYVVRYVSGADQKVIADRPLRVR
jgi:Ca-activated chloride channel family protein